MHKGTHPTSSCASKLVGFTQETECSSPRCNYSTLWKIWTKTVEISSRLYTKQANGTTGLLKDELSIKFFLQGADPVEATFNKEKSTFKIIAPVQGLSDYTGKIQIKDPKNRYVSNIVDVSIPSNVGTKVNAGNLIMITKDDVGCQGSSDVTKCWSDKMTKRGQIEVTVKDS